MMMSIEPAGCATAEFITEFYKVQEYTCRIAYFNFTQLYNLRLVKPVEDGDGSSKPIFLEFTRLYRGLWTGALSSNQDTPRGDAWVTLNS